jgi:hypothetical protein
MNILSVSICVMAYGIPKFDVRWFDNGLLQLIFAANLPTSVTGSKICDGFSTSKMQQQRWQVKNNGIKINHAT